MRIYRLSPPHDKNRLTPREILTRCTDAFAHVESDFDDLDSIGLNVAYRYEQALRDFEQQRASLGFPHCGPTPVDVMKQRWRDAINMHVWLAPECEQRFSAMVTNAPCFEILFSPTVSTKRRRETTYRLASLLDYNADIPDMSDYVDADAGDTMSRPRTWWQFWRSNVS